MKEKDDKVIVKKQPYYNVSHIIIGLYLLMFVSLLYKVLITPHTYENYTLNFNLFDFSNFAIIYPSVVKQAILVLLFSSFLGTLKIPMKNKVKHCFLIIIYSKFFMTLSKKGVFDIKVVLILMIISLLSLRIGCLIFSCFNDE